MDWGQGALGDMGAHLIDHAFWALDLGYADQRRNDLDAVQQGVVSDGDDDLLRVPGARQQAGGQADVVRRRPAAAEARGTRRRASSNQTGGVLFIGSKGKLLHDTYGNKPRLLPKSLHESYGTPPQKMPRIRPGTR